MVDRKDNDTGILSNVILNFGNHYPRFGDHYAGCPAVRFITWLLKINVYEPK